MHAQAIVLVRLGAGSPSQRRRRPDAERRGQGSRGDSYDNALAETTIGTYKAELIEPGRPWVNPSQVRAQLAEADPVPGGDWLAREDPQGLLEVG
ncbi:MAG: hypothetical protein M3N31_02330 [Actinomycetota bacterium]|nr:hypothetical protein [Actinomycetota bacterium]